MHLPPRPKLRKAPRLGQYGSSHPQGGQYGSSHPQGWRRLCTFHVQSAPFGGFRHKFYGTFCRSRLGENIRVCPIPGNVPRKTPTPHGERRRQTRVAQLTPGGASHQPHAHTGRNEISRSGGAPPHSDLKHIRPLERLSALLKASSGRPLVCAN